MPTATLARASAPTEAEIREAIAERAELPFSGEPTKKQPGETWLKSTLVSLIDDYAAPLSEPAHASMADPSDYGDGDKVGLWRDLRHSEARVLREMVEAAVLSAADAAEKVIIDELVKAGLEFAELFPDAPRALVIAK